MNFNFSFINDLTCVMCVWGGGEDSYVIMQMFQLIECLRLRWWQRPNKSTTSPPLSADVI